MYSVKLVASTRAEANNFSQENANLSVARPKQSQATLCCHFHEYAVETRTARKSLSQVTASQQPLLLFNLLRRTSPFSVLDEQYWHPTLSSTKDLFSVEHTHLASCRLASTPKASTFKSPMIHDFFFVSFRSAPGIRVIRES